MKLIKFQGQLAVCVDDFPKDAQRSREGSLHLRPTQTTEITDDEFAYLKANRSDISNKVLVLRSWPDPRPKEPDPAPAEEPAS